MNIAKRANMCVGPNAFPACGTWQRRRAGGGGGEGTCTYTQVRTDASVQSCSVWGGGAYRGMSFGSDAIFAAILVMLGIAIPVVSMTPSHAHVPLHVAWSLNGH